MDGFIFCIILIPLVPPSLVQFLLLLQRKPFISSLNTRMSSELINALLIRRQVRDLNLTGSASLTQL